LHVIINKKNKYYNHIEIHIDYIHKFIIYLKIDLIYTLIL